MLDRGEAVRKLVLNTARLTGAAAMLSPLMGGIGAILMLHRVNNERRPPPAINRHLSISPGFLDDVISDMKRRGYRFVTLDDALERIRAGGHRGERFATITADDGYRDNLTQGLPIFERHATPFTIFVAPGLVNGARDLWWEVLEDVVAARGRLYLDTREGRVAIDSATAAEKYAANIRLHDYFAETIREEEQQPLLRTLALAAGIDPAAHRREALMTWDEIRTLAAHPLATIGAHTMNHYNLKRLGESDALREMVDAARVIEVETGTRPRHMAFPYGYADAVGEREVRLAREAGFESAVTTRHGVLRPEHAEHVHALPRISLNGRYQKVAHLRTMLSGLTTPLANDGRTVVTV